MRLHRKKDTRAEERVAFAIMAETGWPLERAPDFACYDYACPEAVFEIKCRSFTWEEIREAVGLGARKIAECLAEAKGRPFFFVVSDAAGEIRVARMSNAVLRSCRRATGGRSDRGRTEDVELMFYIPAEAFKAVADFSKLN